MKKIIIILLTIIISITILAVGLVPSIHNYLKITITETSYTYLIVILLYIAFELVIHLKFDKKISRSFDIMEESVNFKRFKKEEKYREDKNFYYRDLPFDNNLFQTFWIAYQYKIIDNRTNIINALMLKWTLEKRITFVSKNKYIINDENIPFTNKKEVDLFLLLKGKNTNKFINLNLFNSAHIIRKIDDILIDETYKYKNKQLIFTKKDKVIISKNIKEDVDKVFGLKNFLLHFTDIDDKSIKTVNLWEEYLIYAELLGLSNQVKKELDKANIDYTSTEIRIKKVSKIGINFIRGLLAISYLFYGIIFLLLTLPIWWVYIWITWNYV